MQRNPEKIIVGNFCNIVFFLSGLWLLPPREAHHSYASDELGLLKSSNETLIIARDFLQVRL